MRRRGGDYERCLTCAIQELYCGLTQDIANAHIVFLREQAEIP